MGSGCSSQDNVLRTQHRVMTRRVGNFTFQQYGQVHLDGRLSGTGCRKCPAWETTCTAEEVQKKREEFWDTRVEGSADAWRVLRMACEAPDSSSATEIIKAAGLRFAADQLSQTYDELGMRYDLPPYVMSEPVRYGTQPSPDPTPLNMKDEPIHIVVRSSKAKDQALTLSLLKRARDMKRMYAAQTELPLDNLRFFFNGREMKDDDVLVKFKLTDQVVVQCMVIGG